MHRMNHRYLSLLLAAGLYLGCFRGYVALWKEGAAEPDVIYPCKVTLLPPADRQALAEGIPVRSEKELAHLLEDFLS